MNNKIYIAGKITGDPDYVAKFDHAAQVVNDRIFFDSVRGPFRLRAVNPTTFTLRGKSLACYSWRLSMLVCVVKLLGCSHVYMLNDWRNSKGARIEHRIAKLTRKKIRYQIKQQ